MRLRVMGNNCGMINNLEEEIVYKLVKEFPNSSPAKESLRKVLTLKEFIDLYNADLIYNKHYSTLSENNVNAIKSKSFNHHKTNSYKPHSMNKTNFHNNFYHKNSSHHSYQNQKSNPFLVASCNNLVL
jgi:hypothetical protein